MSENRLAYYVMAVSAIILVATFFLTACQTSVCTVNDRLQGIC